MSISDFEILKELGKGAFGKVRLALSIFGNLKVDIGQLICVKKSLAIGDEKNAKKKRENKNEYKLLMFYQ